MDDDGSVLRVEQGAQPRGQIQRYSTVGRRAFFRGEAPRHKQSGQLYMCVGCSRSAPVYLIKRANPARGCYCMGDEWLGL